MKKPIYNLVVDKNGPLVYLDFALRAGAVRDPVGKEGTASLTMSMLLRGTQKKTAKEFHEALDRLGAEIHLGKNKESLRIYGVVLKENLKPFMLLFKEALTEPRFDPAEFDKLYKQFKSALLDELSSDDDIADRRFQEHLLWGHPYGKMVSGSLQSIENIKIQDLRDFYQNNFSAAGAIFSALGPIDRVKMRKDLESMAKALPAKSFALDKVQEFAWPKGQNLLLLHKAGRTQSQIIIGAKGVGFDDPDYTALQIANHIFGGGSFSARLMKEVREKRGWSYGAYAWYRSSKRPICMSLQTIPATKDTVPALDLMIKLFRDYAKKGVTKAEFEFAKKSLVNQAAFLQDTIRKRLDNKISEILLGLPSGFYDSYLSRLQRLTYAKVQKAIHKKVNSKELFVTVLGDADVLESELRKNKAWKKLIRKNFDVPPGPIL